MGIQTPYGMTRVTLHSHVRYEEIHARTNLKYRRGLAERLQGLLEIKDTYYCRVLPQGYA